MKLVAGLGNPGPRYRDTRHNVGFCVVEALAQRWNAAPPRYEPRFAGWLAEAAVGGQRVLLLRPATYMNRSGTSVAAVWRYFRLAPEDLLVVYDDMDLPPGRLRLRAGGSAGGHHGMQDVLRHLGTDQVPRLRVGIGRAPADAVDHVLSGFSPQERPLIEAALARAVEAAECWVCEGIVAAMDRYNRPPEGPGGA